MIKTTGIEKDLAVIYEIRCLANNAVYIGKTKNYKRRIREHEYSLRKGTNRNKQMQADYNKYGAENFESKILSYDKDNLDKLEAEYIQAARDTGICYNVFSGGSIGYKANQAFRDRMSEVHSGRVDSEETRKKKAEHARRQWQDREYRELMISSARNQWKDESYRQIMHDVHTGRSDACGHKLTAEDVLEMRARYRNGESFSKLSEEFGVTYCTGRSAILAESWRNI